MSEIESKIIKIKTNSLPPSVQFIEGEIAKQGIEPLRWAIVEVQNDILTLSVSGKEI